MKVTYLKSFFLALHVPNSMSENFAVGMTAAKEIQGCSKHEIKKSMTSTRRKEHEVHVLPSKELKYFRN